MHARIQSEHSNVSLLTTLLDGIRLAAASLHSTGSRFGLDLLLRDGRRRLLCRPSRLRCFQPLHSEGLGAPAHRDAVQRRHANLGSTSTRNLRVLELSSIIYQAHEQVHPPPGTVMETAARASLAAAASVTTGARAGPFRTALP